MILFFNKAFDDHPEQGLGQGTVLLLLSADYLSLTWKSKQLSGFSYPLPAQNVLPKAEQICRFVGEGWLHQVQHPGSFGRNRQSCEEIPLCSSTEVVQLNHWGLAQKCDWDSKHSLFQERDTEASRNVCARSDNSFLAPFTLPLPHFLAPKSRQDFLSGSFTAKSYDLKRFVALAVPGIFPEI
ncbi:hypothetical protein P7K49_014068 [Saguinus oedipus]|uniref:Uncharacterized protein n=1 Tax=Saguinus oedipus TaxID=9490 RepID=A0ABQ9VHQ4_SAGOE|nr:hypothetical protein P7K49_014068 [Saguinus oedipus]